MNYLSNKIEYIYLFEGPAILSPRLDKSWIIEIDEKFYDNYLHPKHVIICNRLMLNPEKITSQKRDHSISPKDGQHILELTGVFYPKDSFEDFFFRCHIAKVIPILKWFEDKINEIEMVIPEMDEEDEEFHFGIFEEEFNELKQRINENKKLYPRHIGLVERILNDIDNSLSGGFYMSFSQNYDSKMPDDKID